MASLITQYGEKRRIPVTLDQIHGDGESLYRDGDSRFYEHHGVDPVGIFRATEVVALFSSHLSTGAVPLPSSWPGAFQ